jgi:hypothetical protein
MFLNSSNCCHPERAAEGSAVAFRGCIWRLLRAVASGGCFGRLLRAVASGGRFGRSLRAVAFPAASRRPGSPHSKKLLPPAISPSRSITFPKLQSTPPIPFRKKRAQPLARGQVHPTARSWTDAKPRRNSPRPGSPHSKKLLPPAIPPSRSITFPKLRSTPPIPFRKKRA